MNRGDGWLRVQRQGQRTAVGAPKRHLLVGNCEKRRKKSGKQAQRHTHSGPPSGQSPGPLSAPQGRGERGSARGGGAWR